jgi:hypothetical protein
MHVHPRSIILSYKEPHPVCEASFAERCDRVENVVLHQSPVDVSTLPGVITKNEMHREVGTVFFTYLSGI